MAGTGVGEVAKPVDDAFDAAAERVGQVFEQGMLTRSPFHLAPCGGCGAPSFQQPCMMCGFYPMGTPTAADISPPAKREAFVRAVEGSMPEGRGNLATWYLSSRRKTVAYDKSPRYREEVEATVRTAALVADLPDAGAVFDHVKAGGRMSRPRMDGDTYHLWDVMHQLDMTLEGGRNRAEDGRAIEFVRRMTNEVEAAKRAAVDCIHSGGVDKAEAVDMLSNAVESFMDERNAYRWIPVGNLNSARRDLDTVREGLPELPAP